MRVFEIQPAAFLNKDNNLYTAFQIMVLILSKRKQAIQKKTSCRMVQGKDLFSQNV